MLPFRRKFCYPVLTSLKTCFMFSGGKVGIMAVSYVTCTVTDYTQKIMLSIPAFNRACQYSSIDMSWKYHNVARRQSGISIRQVASVSRVNCISGTVLYMCKEYCL